MPLDARGEELARRGLASPVTADNASEDAALRLQETYRFKNGVRTTLQNRNNLVGEINAEKV